MNQILIFVFDGLQMSQVSHGLMPNLASFADGGVRFENHHSVFPTVTRVNVASITTGRYPGGHGIAGNNFLDRSFHPGRILPALRPELGELFEEAIFEVLKAAGLIVKRKADSGGDITINGKSWEIKTTQGDDIQGATHSSQKPPRYIMIKYKLDYDKALSLENNEGLIIEFGVWISEDIDSDWWHGEATGNNSRTTLKIPIEGGSIIETIIGDFNDSSSHGRKYCKLLNEDVRWK